MSHEKKDPQKDDSLVKIIDLEEDYSFGNMFRVNKARLRFRRFDGRMSEEITRINFERGDSVGVLLYNPDKDFILLTRQFRYPVYASLDPDILVREGAKQAWSLEIVGGIIEPGDSAVETASKEIIEEANYAVLGDLHPIVTIYPSPGGTSERIYLFLGLVDYKEQLDEGGGLPSVGEDIQVERITFKDSMKMIDQGEILDAKTIIALQHLALIKSRGVDFITK